MDVVQVLGHESSVLNEMSELMVRTAVTSWWKKTLEENKELTIDELERMNA